MKRLHYFIRTVLLAAAIICSMKVPGITSSPVFTMENQKENKEIAARGIPSQLDVSALTANIQPQINKRFAAALSLSESNLTQQAQASPPNMKMTMSFPKGGIPVLMYHSISTDKKNSLCVSKEQFREEMEWLHNNAYHSISIDEFSDALINQRPVPENPVLITFDDGYRDNYTTAWPILKQYGFTATFFIVTQYVNPNRIGWDELKELIRQGNSIGSHTVNHTELSKLTEAQQKVEIADSKRILEENTGISIKAFCYPFGNYNRTTQKLLSESGYSIGFTTKDGIVHAGDDPFLLKRVRIWGGMPSSQFIKQVAKA